MLLIVKVLTIIYFFCGLVLASPMVTIKNGTLQGSIITTRNGRQIFSFQGIPYARPPIGDLRFELPQPADSWTDIYIAQKDADMCLQKSILTNRKISGSEDCLYINVYTPQLMIDKNESIKQTYPVMVWFHGGGFHCGSGYSKLYGPKYLLDHDVVLVTFNYRLGPFGFLSTEDMILPGNLGMKDQVQALRWISENIAAFGGDPNQITIFGESAGAASVHYHMISHLSKGLFHRAISQSGNIYSPWALHQPGQAKKIAVRLGNMLNCSTKNSIELVNCLRKLNAIDIIEMQEKIPIWSIDPVITFRPVIEPNHSSAFLKENPYESLNNGNINDVPWLTGINSEEGSIRVLHYFYNKKNFIYELNEKWSELAPMILLYEHTCPKNLHATVTKKIREFYFGKKIIDANSKFDLINMYTDGWFGLPAFKSVKTHLEKFSNPVYYYYLSYRGRYSVSNVFTFFEDYGVCHGDELQYIFPVDIKFFFNLIGLPISTNDNNMIDIMTQLWYNFAKTGNPTPDCTKNNPIKWLPVQTDNLEYLEIKNSMDIKMSDNLNKERIKFWDETLYQLNFNQSYNHIDIEDIKDEL